MTEKKGSFAMRALTVYQINPWMVALNYKQKLHLVVGEGQVPNACTNNDMTWHDKTVNKISLAIPVQI